MWVMSTYINRLIRTRFPTPGTETRTVVLPRDNG